MTDRRNLDELREAAAGRPAPDPVAALYREAFSQFGAMALWNRRPSDHPTIARALAVAESLWREGNMQSRPLAVRIEEACSTAG